MRYLGALSLLLLVGCSVNSRYPGWQHVRIESAISVDQCEYRVQEACPEVSALEGCYNWYKKRATRFKANTVKLTKPGLAEYYFCQ